MSELLRLTMTMGPLQHGHTVEVAKPAVDRLAQHWKMIQEFLERWLTWLFTLFLVAVNISGLHLSLSFVEQLWTGLVVFGFFSPIRPIPSVQQPIPAAVLPAWAGLYLICMAVWLLVHYAQMAWGPMNKVMTELEENTIETNCLCLLWNQVGSITMSWGCRGMENEFPEGIDLDVTD